jgi:hypothetical protein
MADESGDLGVHIDDLIRLKLAGQSQNLVDAAALDDGNLRGRRSWRGLDGTAAAVAMPKNDDGDDDNSRGRNQDP